MQKSALHNPIPELPQSRPVEKGDKPFFKELLSRIQPTISEFTFTNLYVWRKRTDLKIAKFQDAIVLMTRNGIMPSLIARPSLSFFQELFAVLRKQRIADKGIRFPEAMAEILKSSFTVEDDRPNWDYIYRTEKLINLRGRHLDGKRNLIKNFKSAYRSYRYLAIDADAVNKCLALQEEWCDLKRCELDEGLSGENIAIYELFKDYPFFEVTGGIISVEGKTIAFVVGERLNDHTAVIHFEKANPAYTGIYQAINNEFIRNALAGFEFVNREQDLGNDGIRKAKLSYVPDQFVKKYIVYF